MSINIARDFRLGARIVRLTATGLGRLNPDAFARGGKPWDRVPVGTAVAPVGTGAQRSSTRKTLATSPAIDPLVTPVALQG